jgi:hydrogenase maturation protein HypF
MITRTQILIKGIVQGVGFRPFVFGLARENALRGQVLNNNAGVLVDVEGDTDVIDRFIEGIKTSAPPLSLIESLTRLDNLDAQNYADFLIVPSLAGGVRSLPISADIATCADCLREMWTPANRRYRYPFINCTNCGPRFTIIESVPYDRAKTTMREFEMCAACRAEYEDPANRRFHAEPTACADCGPRVYLTPDPASGEFDRREVIENTRELLREGKIVAIKGLGGYHLACDALNAKAVETLRRRKYREDKPFALMAESVETVRRYCLVSDAEAELLSSPARPIVLLDKKPEASIPTVVAPNINTLGFMLPYTPLHHLLLEGLDGPLVMTSGNVSDEPIAYLDSEAAERLKNIADYYLLHDREIHIRTDDSIMRVARSAIPNPKSQIVLRRSRGLAPAPVKTAFKSGRQILACGAELKNTFCITRETHAFVSHHIGDLKNLETLRSFEAGIEHFKRLFDLAPEVIAYDLHPEYLSTKYALAREDIETKIGVQHHHAHIASCLADNGADGEVIGVAMDGLGFGSDGKMWGGEFFVADLREAERVAHLDYIPLPGGARAIREPWRLAAVYLQRVYGDDFLNLDLPFVREMEGRGWETLRQMIRTNTNCPETSSMGRLFDAVAALTGLRNSVNYEGQAAIELEAAAFRGSTKSYEFEIDGNIIKAEKVIRGAVDDLLDGRPEGEVSAAFHLGVVDLIANIALRVRDERNLSRVALSGGVFQNMFLLERAVERLESCGFEVLTHSRVPANDGGISFGQAAVANARLASERSR